MSQQKFTAETLGRRKIYERIVGFTNISETQQWRTA